ncbi:MAG: rhomboid family intramembrane serine protease [Gemmatimonadota bacterium]|nr:MAG: rhomboid family intramembrane serine protease [Gemmatimonadota bacterium]
MFPYKDENPTELVPVLTVGLILANVAAWVLIQGLGAYLGPSVCTFGLIPVELTGEPISGPEICPPGGLTWQAVFTSMFMHGNWIHLISNMLFLWVFGNNIEDSMGHIRFLAFYLLAGVAAAAAHIFFNANSGVPTVGASGAISGILGAYIVLYPQVRVYVFFPPFWLLPMRAYVVLGYWIVIQVVLGIGQLGVGQAMGVAVWAHIGGFVAGLLLVKLFERPQLVSAKREGRRIDPRAIREQRYWW